MIDVHGSIPARDETLTASCEPLWMSREKHHCLVRKASAKGFRSKIQENRTTYT